MHIKKILETRVNINDINDIICSSYDKNILQILKNKYINKCYKSVYILDILKIVKRSGLHCKNKALDGGTYVDISFEVSCIIYEKGDIIHGCKIIQINSNGTMHAKSEYAALYIKNIEDVVVFKENDEIPVIVNMVRYNIYDTEISVSSIPLVPIIKKSTIFKIKNVSDNLSAITQNHLFDFEGLKQIEADITSISKSNKNIFKFFKDLIYPYKIIKKINYGKSETISLESLSSLNQDDLVYKPDSYLDDNTYLKLLQSDVAKVEALYPDTSIIEIDKKEFIIYMLNQYYKNMICLHDFLTTYNTMEKVKAKTTIWNLYTIFKR